MTLMSARRGLATLLCSGAAAAAVLLPSAAHADTLTVADPVGDVVREGPDASGSVPAPQARAVDLVSTRVDYRNQVLVVRGTAVRAANNVGRFVRVKGGGREFFYIAGAGAGVFALQGPDCTGASTSVNKRNGTYTVKIPAQCFGAPAKVRLGFGLSRINLTNEAITIEDAMREGFPAGADNIKLTRAVTRG